MMKSTSALRTILAGLAFLVAPVQAAQMSKEDAAIEYRQQIMITLEAQFKAMAGIIAFNGPAKNLTSHLQAALTTARMVLPSFEKRVHGGASQQILWDEWEIYRMHMVQFEAGLAMAIEAAKFGTVTDVVWYTDQISCRKCHESYKTTIGRGREEYIGH